MPRTPEQLRHAAEATERWLESLDPEAIAAPEADASDLRRLGEAVVDSADAEAEVAAAVEAARANRRSWGQIAAVLGVTRQSARERFAGAASRDGAAGPAPRNPCGRRDRDSGSFVDLTELDRLAR